MKPSNLSDQLEQAKDHVEMAEHVLDNAAQLIRMTRFHFELVLGDEIIRYRPTTPDEFRLAEEMVAFGRNHLETISFDNCPAPANRGGRAKLMAELIRAYVRAQMARVYVEFWKDSKAMKDFGVLAHQAMAFSLIVLDDSWEYFAPLVFVHDHEPTDEETKQHFYYLSNNADAALAYAHCLNAQMNNVPSRLHKKYEQVRAPKPAETPARPAVWPALTSWATGTQAEVRVAHIEAVRDDQREKSYTRQRSRPLIYPKMRLTGFATARGRGKRKAGDKR